MYALRAVGWTTGCLAAPALLGALLGPRWIAIGLALALAATAWLLLWLPRSAHAAFVAGRFRRAARRYRVLELLAFTRSRALSALLSRGGCEVALGRSERATALLGPLDATALAPAERAVLLNNRACLLLDTAERDAAGGAASASTALALVDQAIELRPDVPAIQHTRGRALLGVGRIDDAIAVLDAMRTAGELPPSLEAERCRDLALAWEKKGQGDYASDYRARAELVAR